MAIKYNPYGWEIRPNTKAIEKELDDCYLKILRSILELSRCAGGYTTSYIRDGFNEIEYYEAQLHNAIEVAQKLREHHVE